MTCPCTATSLCAEHQQSFLDILADVPDRLATMMVSVAKQSVTGGQGGSVKNDDNRPLPINIGASDARLALRAELVNVVARVQHCLGEHPRQRDVPGVCAWLATLMPRMTQHPECGDWYTRIRAAYDKTTKAIDTPPERVRAGRCYECNEVLYAGAGNEMVRCRPCGISYTVTNLQDEEIGRVRDYRAGAAMIVKVFAHAGIKLKLKTLASWADRGQVTFATTEDGRVYTVGDVYDVYNRAEGAKLAVDTRA